MEDEIVLDVTEEDIEFGDRRDPNFCAIARRAKLATGCDDVEVKGTIRIGKRRWDLPHYAQIFITDFDEGRPVAPIQIRLKCSEGKPVL